MVMSLSSLNLEAFYTVSQVLNFTKAANKLGITQSALSQRVLNLETELDTTLFIRDRAGLKLTETARDLLRFCQMKNALEDEFLAKIKSKNPKELAGSLRVGGFSSVSSSVLVPFFSSFLKKHRKVHFTLYTKELNDLTALLKRSEIDFMILDDRIQKEELERHFLGSEYNVMVEPKEFEGPNIFLDHDDDDMTTLNYLKKFKLPTKDIKRIFLDDIHGILAGIRQGLGRAVLPLHLVKNDKSLCILNPKDTLEVPVYLYYYSQPYYSKLHQAVVNELVENFKNYLSQ